MIKYWLLASDRFNAMTARERWMAFITAASALCLVAYLLFLDPLLTKRLRYQQQIKQNAVTLSNLQAEEQAALQRTLQDPDAPRQQQILALEHENQLSRLQLADLQARLAAPERMPRLLEDLLKRDSGLELLSIRTMEPENLFQPAAATVEAPAAPPAQPGVYRHGLQVSVRGKYADLAAYARKIETLPWKLYWGNLSLQVERYPQSTMSFTLYTVSMDQAWLSL